MLDNKTLPILGKILSSVSSPLSRLTVVCLATCLLWSGPAHAQEAPAPHIEILWPNGAPFAEGKEEHDIPKLTLHLAPADKATGAAVVVCPGGGYGHLAMDHEGKQVAEWLNSLGITAGILRYRHAPLYRHPVPLLDVQRALRTMRAKAVDWKIDAQRVGVMGFSAGGHLASTAGTKFDHGKGDAPDPIDRQSCRPDVMILAYPVISFTTPYTHVGSRNNLLGKDADAKLIDSLSNELHVVRETPPTFLFHTSGDTAVPPENSILFYMALRAKHIPAELHIFEQGGHGVGLAQKDPLLSRWPARCADWLGVHGFLTRPVKP